MLRPVLVVGSLGLAAAQMCNSKDPDSGGLVIPALGTGGSAAKSEFDTQPMAAFYMIFLLWTFLGVGVIADVFMSAIEVITSKQRIIQRPGDNGTSSTVEVKVWNPTVANLTLMALGSSAPEILLSVIEIMTNKFFSGDLGPSTIVGSAAFNMFIIIGVCVIAIPKQDLDSGEPGVRKIKELGVYAITAFFSLFAYIWLLIILEDEAVSVAEGVISFMWCPVLVGLAYAADIGLFSCNRGKQRVEPEPRVIDVELKDFAEAVDYDGKNAQNLLKGRKIDPNADPELAAKYAMAELEKNNPKSRAYWRIHANRRLMGDPNTVDMEINLEDIQKKAIEENRKPYIGFASDNYAFVENVGNAIINVVREPISIGACTVKYKTIPGSAEVEKDYIHTEGVLEFADGETEKFIEVPIIDDDAVEADEFFAVELSEPVGVELHDAGGSKCTVKIIDDDSPGSIEFQSTDTTGCEYTVPESIGKISIKIVRRNGAQGDITVRVCTKDGSAVGKTDYEEYDENITFKAGELEKTVQIGIVNDEDFEKSEYFVVQIESCDETSKLGNNLVCKVTILNDDQMSKLSEKVANIMNVNMDKMKIGKSDWKEQFSDAISIDQDAGAMEKILGYLSVPWKIIFACTPPPSMCGGWLCFGIALVFITGVTILIGDLAGHLGCALGLKASVTAITFVALGTSLPDTFASKTAAKCEPTADSSIGNVTGSNSVNVFLGLGLPWMIAAIYWSGNAGDAALAEWKQKYQLTHPNLVSTYEKKGGIFIVPKGDIELSVILFVICGAVCLGTLALRRKILGYELGGKFTYPTFFLFVFLWMTYVIVSSLKAYGLV